MPAGRQPAWLLLLAGLRPRRLQSRAWLWAVPVRLLRQLSQLQRQMQLRQLQQQRQAAPPLVQMLLPQLQLLPCSLQQHSQVSKLCQLQPLLPLQSHLALQPLLPP